MHNLLTALSLEQALNTITSITNNIQLTTENIHVTKALHRINSQDIFSKLDLPPFDKAAMDGYAVSDDNLNQYELVETIAAGNCATNKLTAGKTIKIMTGAPIPANTKKIIRLEYATEKAGIVTIHTPETSSNFCPQGEDLKLGDVILQAHHKITPLIIGNLINCGITTVEVKAIPKIAIITTGDEIVDNHELCQSGKTMNSNQPMLVSLCQKHNLEITYQASVPDQLPKITAAINNALQLADIIILTGGASNGDFDLVKSSFATLKLTTHFSSIAIKPGKPTIFASAPNKLIFGLPGNPVAVYLMFHLLILKTVQLLLKIKTTITNRKFALNHDIKRKNVERTEYLPCRINNNKIELINYNGSAHLAALTQSDGFAIIPAGITTIASGELLEVLNI